MRQVRMVGFCCAVVVVAVAVMTSVASAKLPEWGKCEATAGGTGGKYANAGCTLPVKKVYRKYPGGYEWYPLQQTPTEIEEEESTNIKYTNGNLEHGIVQPASETTWTFADGHSIKCGPLIPETEIRLGSVHATTEAPRFAFEGCLDEQGELCHTSLAESEGEINTTAAWRHGFKHEKDSWTGTTKFIEGKDTSEPVVGIVYQAEERHPPGVLLQQIVCETIAGRGTEPLSIVIGGHKAGEELVTEITPVNTMSTSFTASLRQSGGVQLPATLEGHAAKPPEAQVNLGEWNPVGIETTMLFPLVYVGYENRREGEVEKTLELKATP